MAIRTEALQRRIMIKLLEPSPNCNKIMANQPTLSMKSSYSPI
jgi:hypothetical protein